MSCRALQLLYLEALTGEMLRFGEESRKSVLCASSWARRQNPSSVISVINCHPFSLQTNPGWFLLQSLCLVRWLSVTARDALLSTPCASAVRDMNLMIKPSGLMCLRL